MRISLSYGMQLAEVFAKLEDLVLPGNKYNLCVLLMAFMKFSASILLNSAFSNSQVLSPARFGAGCNSAVYSCMGLLRCFATMVQPWLPSPWIKIATAWRWSVACKHYIARKSRPLCSDCFSIELWRPIFFTYVFHSETIDLWEAYTTRLKLGREHFHALFVAFCSNQYCLLLLCLASSRIFFA